VPRRKTKNPEKRVLKIFRDADVLLEVLDARFPDLTRLPDYERLAEKIGKPLIYVLTKADLVPKEWAEDWKKILEKRGHPAVFVSAKQRWGTRILRNTIKDVAPKFPVLVGVFGYANVGKSSLINILKGKTAAQAAPVPGWTKGEQIVKISRKIYLIDTPGIIPMRDPTKLVLIGSYDPTRMDMPELPAEILLRMLHGSGEDFPGTLEEYAIKKNFLLKGGVPDTHRAAVELLTKWQKGKIVPKSTDWLKKLEAEVKEESDE
jgi:ribosome biogenesis GTPase A